MQEPLKYLLTFPDRYIRLLYYSTSFVTPGLANAKHKNMAPTFESRVRGLKLYKQLTQSQKQSGIDLCFLCGRKRYK